MTLKIITIDPGKNGAVVAIESNATVLALKETRPVTLAPRPHKWPNKSVNVQEDRIIKAQAAGKPDPKPKPKDPKKPSAGDRARLKDWGKAVGTKPDSGSTSHLWATRHDVMALASNVWGLPPDLVICESPALGQAGATTAGSIASTAESAALLTCQAAELGIPVIMLAPSQWQPSGEGDSKARAFAAVARLFEIRANGYNYAVGGVAVEGMLKTKLGAPHDGVIDAIAMGIWTHDNLGEILLRLGIQHPASIKFWRSHYRAVTGKDLEPTEEFPHGRREPGQFMLPL